jgi:acetaldehyde dehydrogenase (acetylating)
MTLGCGTYGGNITSDNISPMHLINIKRLAFEVRPADLTAALSDYGYEREEHTAPVRSSVLPSVAEQVSDFLDRRGFTVQSEAVPVSSSPSQPDVDGGSDANPGAGTAGDRSPSSAEKENEPVAAMDFVSENDVRAALAEGRKLPVGPRSVITPSARDLGNEHNVFLRV